MKIGISNRTPGPQRALWPAFRLGRGAGRALVCGALLAVAASPLSAMQRNDPSKMPASAEVRHDGQPVDAEHAEAVGEFAGVHAIMSDQLADNLSLLFEKFGRAEFIVCLEGEVKDGELHLRDFRMPHIAYSRSTSAGLHPDGTCAQYENIVGTLHTHPPTPPEDRGREWANCYLSRTDIVSWLDGSSYPFTAVMCGPRVWSWWHRSQVDPDRVLAFPPDNQLHGAEKASGPNT